MFLAFMISRRIRDLDCLSTVLLGFLDCLSTVLLGFFGLLRISNIAPPFTKAFDPNKHLLRRDVSFLHPGTHIRLKWAKNIQAPERVHVLKLFCIKDPIMCPTQTLKALTAKKVLKPSDPLASVR